MTLYIHPENQKLLWTTMNQSALFQPLPSPMKEQFFKSVIQLFYEKYKNIQLTADTLKQLNKDTILIMTNKLKENQRNSGVSPPQGGFQGMSPSPSVGMQNGLGGGSPLLNNYMTPTSSTIHPNLAISKDAEKGERKDVFSRMFQDRQKEYELMNSKPNVQEVDFKIKTEDEPISETSMSKMIERHLKEREMEVGLAYYPASIVPPPNVPPNVPVASSLQSAVTISSSPPVVQPVAQESVTLSSLLSQMIEMQKEMQKEMQELRQTIRQYLPMTHMQHVQPVAQKDPIESISKGESKEVSSNATTNGPIFDPTFDPIHVLKREIQDDETTSPHRIHVEIREIS